MGLAALAWVLGWVVSPISKSEFAGPVAMLVLVGIAVVVLIAWLVVDAVRDLSPARRQHRALDIARIDSAAVLLLFAIGIGIATRTAGAELAEAPVFALVAGLSGAFMIAGADLATALVARGKTDEAPAPAAPQE